MFGRKKDEELRVQQMMLSSFEESKKTNAIIVSSLNQIIAEKSEKKEDEKEISPDTAAYALNLCTVSVSQIIDYEDLVILEQEYDAILNNLNLENIPKDEALLNILKQILDTVTFFRIQAGDRKMIEKQHQQKMKDAIWSAVPSFGMIVAGGNIWTALVSIASQVGVGYMNYRKTKAANSLEYENQMWQLQRSAIEQLNGLRRELFDASWRLADKYKFKEEKRLTEKQISQYDEILMDSNDLRRYERLASISEFFEAFPPFWYNLGHAANMVYQRAYKDKEYDIADKFRNLAIDHYETYVQNNKYNLLREDLINSSCALEYIDLLDIEIDKEKIRDLLDSAVKSSGRACDVLQLCALAYLRIGEIASATEWLKYLVNEGYNDVTNAQLLSYIYVNAYIQGSDADSKIGYKLLSSRVNKYLLFPMPDLNEEIEELTAEFEKNQKTYLLKKYAVIIERVMARYTIKFNQCIPVPIGGKVYAEEFFTDYEDNRNERYNQYVKQFNRENDKLVMVERLESANIFFEWINVFNEMLNSIEKLLIETENQNGYVEKVMTAFSDNIESKFEKNEDVFSTLQEKMSNTFEVEDFERLFKYSFEYFTKDVFSALIREVYQSIFSFKDMSSVTSTEIELKKFCSKNKYQDPDVLLGLLNSNEEMQGDKIYISSDILGGAAFDKAEESKLVKEMAKAINAKVSSVVVGNKEKVYPVLKFGTGKQLYKDFFKKKKYTQNYRSILVGAIVDKSIGKSSIVFTARGMLVEEILTGLNVTPAIIDYSKISLEDGYLNLDGKPYKNSNLNLELLYEIIQDLNAMVMTRTANNPVDSIEMAYDKIPLLDVIDTNVFDVLESNEFEMMVLTRLYKSNGEIEIYGEVLRGGGILPGGTLSVCRNDGVVGTAVIERFEENSEGSKKDGTIWVSKVSCELMRGDRLVLIK